MTFMAVGNPNQPPVGADDQIAWLAEFMAHQPFCAPSTARQGQEREGHVLAAIKLSIAGAGKLHVVEPVAKVKRDLFRDGDAFKDRLAQFKQEPVDRLGAQARADTEARSSQSAAYSRFPDRQFRTGGAASPVRQLAGALQRSGQSR